MVSDDFSEVFFQQKCLMIFKNEKGLIMIFNISDIKVVSVISQLCIPHGKVFYKTVTCK